MCASRTNHSSSTPAISRSLMDSMLVFIRLMISGGKSTEYMMYRFLLFGPGRIHTPPALYLHESKYP